MSNAIFPPPSSVKNIVTSTQATMLDLFQLPSREVLMPGTTRKCESIARPLGMVNCAKVVWQPLLLKNLSKSNQ